MKSTNPYSIQWLNIAVIYDLSIIHSIFLLEEAQTATQSKDFPTFLKGFENIVKFGKQSDSYESHLSIVT